MSLLSFVILNLFLVWSAECDRLVHVYRLSVICLSSAYCLSIFCRLPSVHHLSVVNRYRARVSSSAFSSITCGRKCVWKTTRGCAACGPSELPHLTTSCVASAGCEPTGPLRSTLTVTAVIPAILTSPPTTASRFVDACFHLCYIPYIICWVKRMQVNMSRQTCFFLWLDTHQTPLLLIW